MNNSMPTSYRTMVATPHYLASAAGSAILQQGGNAFDASVAISAVLAVVYPHMTGLGGDAFFMLQHDGKQIGLNGSGRSGQRAALAHYAQMGLAAIPLRGAGSAITVPGMVDAWWQVWSAYGRLPWEQVLQQAVQYAEDGFPISRDLYKWMCLDRQYIAADKQLAKLYMPAGRLLAEGERLRQPNLAASLKAIQTGGRDVFYKGSLMQSIVAAIEDDGGLLTEADFANHHSDWVHPVSTDYRGYQVHQMPPNSQGFSVLMMLNILELVELGRIPRMSAEFYHLAVESVKQAFAARDRYLTDPLYGDIPLDLLLSKDYAKQCAANILPMQSRGLFQSKASGQDTAYAAVVDQDGNAASFIQSLYFDFGSCYIAGSTGIIMQNRGSYFSLDAAHVNVLEPHKRTFHTLMPGMVTRAGQLFALVGTQGGEGQPQTQLSLLTGLIDYGLTIQQAIALPRWVYGRTWGNDSDSVKLENRALSGTAERLQEWGHPVELVAEWDGLMGQAQGIVIDRNGLRSGAADPRGDGLAIGW